MDSPYQLQHHNAHTDRLSAVGPSSSMQLQAKSSLLPSIMGSKAVSHTLVYEELGSVSPFPESMSSSPLSFYTANTSPSCSPSLLWYSVKSELYAWSFSTSQQEGLIRASPFSTNSSPLSFYTSKTSTSDFRHAKQRPHLLRCPQGCRPLTP